MFKIDKDIFCHELKKGLCEASFMVEGSEKLKHCYCGKDEDGFYISFNTLNDTDFNTDNIDMFMNIQLFDGYSLNDIWNRVYFFDIERNGKTDWMLKTDATDILSTDISMFTENGFDFNDNGRSRHLNFNDAALYFSHLFNIDGNNIGVYDERSSCLRIWTQYVTLDIYISTALSWVFSKYPNAKGSYQYVFDNIKKHGFNVKILKHITKKIQKN